MDRRNFLVALSATALASLKLRAEEARGAAEPPQPGLASDPLRPQYHLLPPGNWMNDPNGPIYWNGKYHMFYQCNPHGAVWGDMHWGHAISDDMVHWKHLPIALAPTPGGPDADGCFTGTAFVDQGQVKILYTGVRSVPQAQATIKDGTHSYLETQCLATAADPELRSWTKRKEPVIAAPPASLQVNGFRDPSPWKQGGWWYTVLGSGVANLGGAVLLFRSRNLRSWEFVRILAGRSGAHAGRLGAVDPWEVWECPEFFPLGDRHVLIHSTMGKAWWQSGKLATDSMTFVPERGGILDYGSFYAPKTQLDKAGNRILWGWIMETRPVDEYKAAGWAGMMSLPRVLTLNADGDLLISVAPEVQQLRGEQQKVAPGEQAQGQIEQVRLQSCCGEVRCVARRGSAPFALSFAGSGEAQPWLTVRYDPAHHEEVLVEDRPVPVSFGANGDVEFHAYADGSVIELLIAGRAAWTKRFYYTGKRAQDMLLRWDGDSGSVRELSAWQMTPISNDRLTT